MNRRTLILLPVALTCSAEALAHGRHGVGGRRVGAQDDRWAADAAGLATAIGTKAVGGAPSGSPPPYRGGSSGTGSADGGVWLLVLGSVGVLIYQLYGLLAPLVEPPQLPPSPVQASRPQRRLFDPSALGGRRPNGIFNVAAIDDSGRYAIERRTVGAQDRKRAGAEVLAALQATRPDGHWRVANVAPIWSPSIASIAPADDA